MTDQPKIPENAHRIAFHFDGTDESLNLSYIGGESYDDILAQLSILYDHLYSPTYGFDGAEEDKLSFEGFLDSLLAFDLSTVAPLIIEDVLKAHNELNVNVIRPGETRPLREILTICLEVDQGVRVHETHNFL